MILVDGENLVFRYQKLLERRKPKGEVKHIKDCFIWHRQLEVPYLYHPIRVNYYTSMVGDEAALGEVERKISEINYRGGQMCPKVFKKAAQKHKSRLVDISICIDAMRHSNHRDVEAIFLMSGDGDFLPLIEEVKRNGTPVWVGAFSDGLNPKLRPAVDKFFDLDSWFFEPVATPPTAPS